MFKKLKSFYQRNRVYSILMIISIICIIAIIIGVGVYFLNQTTKDKYGNRLEGIENVKIEDKKIKEVEEHITANELVNNTELDIRGKLIYIIITLNNGTHANAETIAQDALTQFSDEEKAFYDINFIIENNDKETKENFPIMGYIRAGATVIKWTHYSTSN